jgi:general secretion pathway protein F
VSLLAMALVFMIMVPAIAPLFEGEGRPMPPVLRIAAEVIRICQDYGVLLVLLLAAPILSAFVYSRTASYRQVRDRLCLEAPILGPLFRMSATAQAARTCATLLRSGASVPKALSITAGAAQNSCFRAGLARAAEQLQAGARLSDVLSGLEVLPESSLSLILVGERTNRLAEMLLRVADMNEKDLSRGIERLMTILTPALTLAVGALVGGLVLSVMMAILSTNDLAF